MSAYRYAVVIHDRWDESEEPTATVIRSTDGWVWHEVCTCGPENAQEVAEALGAMEDIQRTRSIADRLACGLLDGPFAGENRRESMPGSEWKEVHDALDAWEKDWNRD